MFKKTLLFIYSLMLLTTGLFAETSFQSQYLNKGGYVDIGYQDIAKAPETSIAKELVLIPAKVKKLDEIIDYRARDLEVNNCNIDDDGSEMCPKDTSKCDANVQYNDGFSKEYNAIKKFEINPTLITEAASEVAYPCNDHYLSVFYFYVPSENKIQILYSNASPGLTIGHNCGGYNGGFKLSAFNNISRSSYNGRLTLDIKSHGYGCTPHTRRVTLENLPEVDKSLSLWEAVDLMKKHVPTSYRTRIRRHKISKTMLMRGSNYGGYYFFNIAFCDAGGAQWPNVVMKGKVEEYKCPKVSGIDYNLDVNTFIDNKNCPPQASARHKVKKQGKKWHYYDASAKWYGTNGRGLDLLITDLGTEYELKWRYLKDDELGGNWTGYKTAKLKYGGEFKDTFNILDWGGFILDTKKGILKSNNNGENSFNNTVGSFDTMHCIAYNRKCVGYMPYKYYTYHCPEANEKKEVGVTWNTTNKNGEWNGPKIPGGDCGGIGVDKEKRCQPATPPSKNCIRTFFTCPLNPNNPCYKEPSNSNPIKENYQGTYEYTAGIGKTEKKTIKSDVRCINGGSYVDGVCILEAKTKCLNGGTLQNGKCEAKIEESKCDGEFIQDTGICITDPSMVCAEGYVYDDFRKRCAAPQECLSGYILTEDGTCELDYSYTNYSCPAGWEGPFYGKDNDCKGSCGTHGCECNSALPPMQNCRRAIKPNTQDSYEVKERTPMLIYSVIGSGLAPNGSGQTAGIACDNSSKPCPSNISKIVAEKGGLSFYTNDNRKEFIKVNGCSFTGTIGVDNHEIKDLYIDKDLRTIKSRKSPGKITSTCQLNGHVGWADRAEGITSVAPKSLEKPYVTMNVKGSGKTHNAEWEGFNTALMAIQLSDGHWYVMTQLKDKNDKALKRDIPKGVMGLPDDYYRLGKSNKNLKCKFNGKDTPGYCANELQIVMPEKGLYITGISDIYSLAKKEESKKNNFSFEISFGKDGAVYQYKGNGVVPSLNLEIPAAEMVTSYNDKLIFWDSYIDGDIGFLEFVRNVRPKDKENGFVPDNMTPYNMALKGYTSIDNVKAEVGFGSIAQATSATYFIAPFGTSTCSKDAEELNGVVISYNDLFTSKASSIIGRGAVDAKSCVIRVVEPNDFQSILYASKTKAHSNSFTYKCSKWTCVGAQCTIARCPTDRVNINGKMQEVEFRGNIIPDMVRSKIAPDACLAQECDGAYAYGEVCGIRYQPTLKSSSISKQNDTYMQHYCDEGTLSENGKSCYVKRCPNGTKEQSDGSCKKER